jgi:hypothetical protein
MALEIEAGQRLRWRPTARECPLQECNLPRLVEVVLRQPDELGVRRLRRVRNEGWVELAWVETDHRLPGFGVEGPKALDRRCPAGLGWLRHGRPVLVGCELSRVPPQPARTRRYAPRWRTNSQMPRAPGIGRAWAWAAVTPASSSRTARPCHAPPSNRAAVDPRSAPVRPSCAPRHVRPTLTRDCPVPSGVICPTE